MKKYLVTLAVVLLAAWAGTGLLFAQASRQPTSDDIKRNCSGAQQYLATTLKPRDLRARVDRLQAYQYTSKRLNLFVVRLERHKQPYAQQLRAAENELNQKVALFKSHYEDYDMARENLVALGECAKNINEFKSRLNLARKNLALVQADEAAIDMILNTKVEKPLAKFLAEQKALEAKVNE